MDKDIIKLTTKYDILYIKISLIFYTVGLFLSCELILNYFYLIYFSVGFFTISLYHCLCLTYLSLLPNKNIKSIIDKILIFSMFYFLLGILCYISIIGKLSNGS